MQTGYTPSGGKVACLPYRVCLFVCHTFERMVRWLPSTHKPR